MTRLVIDARMLGYSGIGTYVRNLLPLALPPLQTFDPLVLVLPRDVAAVGELVSGLAQHRIWDVAPLTHRELARTPRDLDDALWWVPHYNVPLHSPAPLVVTLHDLLPLHLPPSPANVAKRLALRMWLHAIRKRARRVLCISESTRRDAIAHGRLDPAQLEVVHLGVDAAWRPADPSTTKPSPPYIVFVGLVKPHKNLAALLRAFESISDVIAHRLVVVGKHEGLRDVDGEALALARRLAPRVELHDSVPKAELVALVAGAELLVQPSLYEGFGLPPLEAMACGVPVVAARTGALEEVGSDAVCYCDPASIQDIAAVMLKVLRDEHLRTAMRERGIARAAQFTWQACAAATARAIAGAIMAPSEGSVRR